MLRFRPCITPYIGETRAVARAGLRCADPSRVMSGTPLANRLKTRLQQAKTARNLSSDNQP